MMYSKSPKFAYGSIIVGITVIFLKYLSYRSTGSMALYADALENVVNLFAAVVLVIAMRLSAIPADSSHHYGHHKVQYLSAGLEGGLIMVMGVGIIHESYLDYQQPRVLDIPMIGIVLSVVGTAMNFVWGKALLHYGKKFHSPALIADGKHLLSDVLSSVGVVVGVGIAIVSGVALLDNIIACLVGVQLLYTGYHVLYGAANALIDAAPDANLMAQIRSIIVANYEDAIEVHYLKVRMAEPAMFIEFHLVMPGETKVRTSHALCNKIEKALIEQLPYELMINIHVEPEEEQLGERADITQQTTTAR